MSMKVTGIPGRVTRKNLYIIVVWESSLIEGPLKPLLRS